MVRHGFPVIMAVLGAVAMLWVPSVSASQLSTTGPGLMNKPVAKAPANSNSQATTIGHEVMKWAVSGPSVAGVVVRQSSAALWIRPVFSHKGTKQFQLSPHAVIWKGGWRFLGKLDLHHVPVDLVIKDKKVMGILEYHDAYGRVIKHHDNWVTIQTVTGPSGSNPACRASSGTPFMARINAGTVWNSRQYLLPLHSLVQYTVYGVPGYPFMLGGVEDYGQAACPTQSPRSALGFGGLLMRSL